MLLRYTAVMIVKPMMTIAVLTIIYMLLAVALVSDDGTNDERLFGRAILPMTFHFQQPVDPCVSELWGKAIYRRCE